MVKKIWFIYQKEHKNLIINNLTKIISILRVIPPKLRLKGYVVVCHEVFAMICNNHKTLLPLKESYEMDFCSTWHNSAIQKGLSPSFVPRGTFGVLLDIPNQFILSHYV